MPGWLSTDLHAGQRRPIPLRSVDTRVEPEEAFARLPPGSVIGYETAAAWWGILPGEPDPAAPIHVLVPAGVVRPRIRGIVCHESTLPLDRSVVIDGVAYASMARCAVDLARTLDQPTALAILDAALRSELCTAADLRTEVDRHERLRGVRPARGLVAMADGRAESVQESHLRLILADGCLPAAEPGVMLEDWAGYRWFRIGLAYREHKIGLDHDGRWRPTLREMAIDRERVNWLRARGWAVLSFTDHDLHQSPGGIVVAVRALLRERSRPSSPILQL